MGLYTLLPKPLFAIDRMTPLPLVDPSFYRQVHTGKHVFFPLGLVVCGQRVHVSYGQDDANMRVLTVDRATFLRELMPVR